MEWIILITIFLAWYSFSKVLKGILSELVEIKQRMARNPESEFERQLLEEDPEAYDTYQEIKSLRGERYAITAHFMDRNLARKKNEES